MEASNDLYSFIGAIFTRIGAILLLTFGVQILINLYKYNMRMSAFYDALADSVELDQTNPDPFKHLPHLSPDKINFERGVKAPSSEMIELLKEFAKARQAGPPGV